MRIGAQEINKELLVPQSAIAQDEHGNYVMVVKDGIAEQRRVTLGKTIGTEQVVKSGLTIDDKVIIQGLQKVSNGSKVKAQLVTQEDSLEAAADKAAGKEISSDEPVVQEHSVATAIQAENVDANSPTMSSSTPDEEEEEDEASDVTNAEASTSDNASATATTSEE